MVGSVCQRDAELLQHEGPIDGLGSLQGRRGIIIARECGTRVGRALVRTPLASSVLSESSPKTTDEGMLRAEEAEGVLLSSAGRVLPDDDEA